MSVVEVDDEKPPAYDSLNGAAEQDLELPSVQQKRNTFIGEFVELVIKNWLAGMHNIFFQFSNKFQYCLAYKYLNCYLLLLHNLCYSRGSSILSAVVWQEGIVVIFITAPPSHQVQEKRGNQPD